LAFLGGAIAIVYMIKLLLGSAFVKSLLLHDKVKEFSHKIRNGLEGFLSNGPKEEE
jgi:hypothetical protein